MKKFNFVLSAFIFVLFISNTWTEGASKELQIPIILKNYSNDPNHISIGIANRINIVSVSGTESIQKNKSEILRIIDIFKNYKVNMILFPEFSLTGYFWDDKSDCWDYMRKGVTDNHMEWVGDIKSRLDGNLQYIIFNNIRLDPKDPGGRFLNSTYIISKDFDCRNLNAESNESLHIYDKTFLPGIEKIFTKSGKTDLLVLETKWGNFGFTTCYDMCFTQIFKEYTMFYDIDAFVQLASWRGTKKREYPEMDVRTESYYGFIWDLMAASQAAFNQAWVFACNAVGKQQKGRYTFWGGSGVWAPSGMKLIQSSNRFEELIVVSHIDIKGQTEYEQRDFSYHSDFIEIYDPIDGFQTFSRMNKRN